MQPLELQATENGPEIEVIAIEKTPVPPPSADELIQKADALGDQLRQLIVEAKKLPRDKALEPHQDAGRALSLAQVNLQTGFMWLRRAIKSPKEF